MANKSLPEQVKASSRQRPPVEEKTLDLVSTGSTLLNLACSDTWAGGFGKGKLVNIIGDSHSGKTLLALSVLAEAARDMAFDNHRLIYDDVEAAMEFDLGYLFGSGISDRIESPAEDEDGEPDSSHTIEDLQSNISRALKQGDPFIYILDSLDALTSLEDIKKAEEQEKAREKGKEAVGSYGVAKAKQMSQMLRKIIRDMKKTDSTLVIVSQVRENLNPAAFSKKYRAGGKALKFYCTHEIWLAVTGKIKKKDRIIGSEVKAKITKNKITGKVREVEFSMFNDYGIDDIGSCIDFLTNEGYWSTKKQTILATDFDFSGTRASLIKYIEENSREKKLARLTGKVWNRIEDSLKLGRKGKYQ